MPYIVILKALAAEECTQRKSQFIQDHLTVGSLTEQCQYLLSISCIFGRKACPTQ